MKRRTPLLLSLLLTLNLQATTMTELFDALKNNPSIRLDELSIKSAKVGHDLVSS